MRRATLEQIINETIRRILTVVQAKRIFVFGSAARGTMHENSDIDLMVVVPSGVHRRKTSQQIYRNLIGVGFAADIVVVTEDDVEKYRETEGLIIGVVLREGKLIYAA
jgi:predicted nucleotidyltransferase